MKKIINFLLAFVLLFTNCIALSACDFNEKVDETKLQVVSTIFPGYDFAKQIGGEAVQSWMLLSPGQESHSYEPSPKDIIKIKTCDVFIYIGGEADSWVESILNAIETPIKTIKMIDYVTPVCIEGDHFHEHEEEENEHAHSVDEHVWTSPLNAKAISKAIADTFAELDQTNANMFSENYTQYATKLDELHNSFNTFFAGVQNKTLVFGDRFPMVYFANEYGLTCYSAFNGCSTETEASTAKIAELIEIVKTNSLKTVFYMEFSNHKIADSIAESTKTKTAALHACHNVSKKDFRAGVTYIDLMTKNLNTLKEAL